MVAGGRTDIPYGMGLTILGALAQLLEVDRVGVEADVREVPDHSAAALDRAPRPILLKQTRTISNNVVCCQLRAPEWFDLRRCRRRCLVCLPYHNAVHELLGLAFLPERLEGGDPRREEAVPETHQRAAQDAEPQPEAEQHGQHEEHG